MEGTFWPTGPVLSEGNRQGMATMINLDLKYQSEGNLTNLLVTCGLGVLLGSETFEASFLTCIYMYAFSIHVLGTSRLIMVVRTFILHSEKVAEVYCIRSHFRIKQ